jgi:hypothetical protein
MPPRKISPYHFVAVWELADSPEQAAAALNRSVRKVRAMARYLKEAGVRLKDMPTSKPLTITQFAFDSVN